MVLRRQLDELSTEVRETVKSKLLPVMNSVEIKWRLEWIVYTL